MKIVITGVGGFVGTRLYAYLRANHEVIGLSHEEMDITNFEIVKNILVKLDPDILIHCAAISDIELCEREKEHSYQINVTGTKNICEGLKKSKVRIIFLSSDQVYDGTVEERPHKEKEILTPPTSYAVQKLKAEKIVLGAGDNLCLRLSLMFDPVTRYKNEHPNLVFNLKKQLNEGKPFFYPINDYRSVTNVYSVIKNIEKSFFLPTGIYNFGSENEYSTYELVQRYLQMRGIHTDLLKEGFRTGTRTGRRVLLMDTQKIQRYGITFEHSINGMLNQL